MTFRFEAETTNYVRYKEVGGINKMYLPKPASGPVTLEEFTVEPPQTAGYSAYGIHTRNVTT